MKLTLLALLLNMFAVQSFANNYTLNKSIHSSKEVSFLKHVGSSRWDNYLTLNIPLEPIADLFKQLLLNKRKQMTNRGEAHITIISPIEFWENLRPLGISMKEINEIALKHQIQSSKFEIICLGIGTAMLDGKKEETYYVVVKSKDLISIRKGVESIYLSKLQKNVKPKFIANNYYPHITLAFTKKDLHESNGVIKDLKSCVHSINEI